MRFKDFIAEAVEKDWDATPTSATQAVALELLDNKSFMRALRTGGLLFRGDTEIRNPTRINPAAGRRTSRDTNNGYQLAMDESEALPGIPSRGRSLIMTTDREFAARWHGGDDEYCMVVPDDGATIVRLSVSDILDVELNCWFAKNIAQFNKFMANLAHFAKVPRTNGKLTDATALNAALTDDLAEDVVEMIELAMHGTEELSASQKSKLTRMFKEKSYERFTMIATIAMTPQTLGIDTFKYGDATSTNNECWTDAKCWVIPIKSLIRMVRWMIDNDHIEYKDIHILYRSMFVEI